MAALVKYKYLGMSSVVEVDYPTPEVKLDLWGQTPGTYTGLDRFGRVINHPWINCDTEEDVARIQHGYDRNSNRLWRQNDVARALSKKFDQQYTYDGLNRLTDARTGLLNGSHVIPPGSDTTFEQEWSLDYVGNWSCFKQDDDGGGTFDLEQTRTANPINEITDIDASVGPTWITPQYDPAGNTTSFPKPAAPTESFTAVYDAWNRMVKVIDNETDDIMQENVYDGRNFRIIKKTYDEGVLDETRHIYYTSSWQAIEERLGTDPDSADAAQQYVWGIRYIDDLVLRDRDTSEPPDGVLNERLYALQDPNWNVTTIIDDSGDVQERYEYEAYGTAILLDDDWDPHPGFLFKWSILYAGYHRESLHDFYLVRNRIFANTLGLWLQRDPVAYLAGINFYSYATIRPATMIDPWGLNPNETRFRLPFLSDALDAASSIAGAAASLLTGDIFDSHPVKIQFDSDQCDFLLTINGILNSKKDADDFSEFVSKLPFFSKPSPIKEPQITRNLTHGILDFVQIIAHEIGLIDVSAKHASQQISAFANAAKRNNCKCPRIYVVAHSQGTAIFGAASRLIPDDTAKIITYVGIGGQKAIPAKGFLKVTNYINRGDIVPLANLLPASVIAQLLHGGSESLDAGSTAIFPFEDAHGREAYEAILQAHFSKPRTPAQ